MLPPGRKAVQCKTAVFIKQIGMMGNPVAKKRKGSRPSADPFLPENRLMTVAEDDGIQAFCDIFRRRNDT